MTAPRYLGLIGDAPPEADKDLGILPPDLRLIVNRARFRLWASKEAVGIGDFGAVVGHLFTRSRPVQRVLTLTSEHEERIRETNGSSLFEEFWGGYVAFVETQNGSCRVLRDPSGSLPAYWLSHGQQIAIAAEILDYPSVVRAKLRVDVGGLTAHLWDLHHLGEQTCLNGEKELLPGHALNSGRSDTCALWSPWVHVASRTRSRAVDPEELRLTVVDTVQAWASCFDGIVLGMSGGLDSSIIGSVIGRLPISACGLNMAWSDREGDERAFAQQAADAFGMPLRTFQYQLDQVDVAAPVVATAPRPFLAPYVQSIVLAQDAVAGSMPVSAFFSGEGGDGVFGLMQSVTPVVDRLYARSSLRELVGTVRDVATLTGGDLMTIAKHTLGRLVGTRSQRAAHGDPSFLVPSRLHQALDRVSPHPWFKPPSATLPGSAAHVRMIRRALGNDGFHTRLTHPPTISPLLAQPIVEMCLGIPSWEWVRNGIDRSVARSAFAGDLPAPIIRRRSKGGPSGFLDHLFWENEAKILDHLRSGFLARNGIITGIPADPDGGQGRGFTPAQPRRLLSLAAAESWARCWN